MKIKSNIKAGSTGAFLEVEDSSYSRRPTPPPPPPPPPPHYTYTCDHCKGRPLGGGKIGNATCNSCW